jgi:hypothetical protein
MARSAVFRYKGQAADPQEVGRALDVHAVLSGRLFQQGNNLIVSVELINTSDGSQLWGERFKREVADVFEVQQEIAREIAYALNLGITAKQKKRLARDQTRNIEAYPKPRPASAWKANATRPQCHSCGVPKLSPNSINSCADPKMAVAANPFFAATSVQRGDGTRTRTHRANARCMA